MSFADNNPGYRLTSEDEARNWILELVRGVEAARAAVDVQLIVQDQRKAWTTWLVKHGGALGSLMALHRVGLIGDVAYNDLQSRILRTTTPTEIVEPQDERRRR